MAGISDRLAAAGRAARHLFCLRTPAGGGGGDDGGKDGVDAAAAPAAAAAVPAVPAVPAAGSRDDGGRNRRPVTHANAADSAPSPPQQTANAAATASQLSTPPHTTAIPASHGDGDTRQSVPHTPGDVDARNSTMADYLGVVVDDDDHDKENAPPGVHHHPSDRNSRGLGGITPALGDLSLGKQAVDEDLAAPVKIIRPLDTDPEAVRIREENQFFIGEALEMARLALRTNETPVGCVLVHKGTIIARGMNATNVTRNGTRHAELMAISALLSVPGPGPKTRSLKPWILKKTEPSTDESLVAPEAGSASSVPVKEEVGAADVTTENVTEASDGHTNSIPVNDGPSARHSTKPLVNEDAAELENQSAVREENAEDERRSTASSDRPPDQGNEDGSKGHLYPYGQRFVGDERVDPKIIRECILYVTVEPCVMCASLLRQFGIKKVYFGAVNDKFGGTGGVFSIHANSLPVSEDGQTASAHPLPREPQSQLPDSSGTLGLSYPPGGGDGGNVEPGYEIEGGWGRDEAVGLLRRFYVQENGRAPVPRKKEGRAARLAAMMEKDGNASSSTLGDGANELSPGDAAGYDSLGDSNKENENNMGDMYEDGGDYLGIIEGDMTRHGSGMGL